MKKTHVREIPVGINDWIEAYRRIAMYHSGARTASMRFLAFAETMARAIFDDIQRGDWGGTYYMDGRAVRADDPELYGVGGAYPTGITFEKDEIGSYVDVEAAVQLLREVIVDLQSDSDDPVAIGFWLDSADGGLCWFDASNVIRGEEEALSLARKRGELAIYHFAENREIRVASRTRYVRRDGGRGYAEFMARRRKRMM